MAEERSNETEPPVPIDPSQPASDESRPAPAGQRLAALRRRVEELTTDIGSVLHANTSILFMTQQTLDVALRAFGPNPFGDDTCPTVEEADEALAQPVHQAVRALDKFLAVITDQEREGVVGPEDLETLAGFRAILIDVAGHVPIAESRPSTLRTIACRIEDILDRLPAGRYPRELVRNLSRAAREIERRVAVAMVLQTRSAILQMDYTIRSFREFVTTDIRPSERAAPLAVAALVEEAHRQLVEYANTSNVEVRPRDQARGARVVGIERELVRAFGNLLHNAIKYSWHRDGARRSWVSVHTYRSGGMICVEFENWGVPVSAQELEQGRVFELGYRGKLSTDRGRLGTGIGLTDARDIAERHRGSIAISSRPARSWGPDDPEDDDYYSQPFITAVVVCLPEAV